MSVLQKNIEDLKRSQEYLVSRLDNETTPDQHQMSGNNLMPPGKNLSECMD